MSTYSSGVGCAGDSAESISRRLREAEARRAEVERAHSEALSQVHSGRARDDDHLLSRVRELEKKAALETVRCEELQLELSTALRSRGAGGGGGGGVTWATSTVTAPANAEIERIMAKIEQDNKILAELDHTRSTTMHGIQSSGSNQGLGDYHSPTPSPLPYSYASGVSSSNHAPIAQSTTMPSLSALHSNLPYSNHQVTFSNPVTASITHNSNIPLGLHNNLSSLSNNIGFSTLQSQGLGVNISSNSGGLTSCLTNVQSSLTGGLPSSLGGLHSTLTGLGNTGTTFTQGPLSGINQGYSSITQNTFTNPLLSSGFGTNAMNIKLKPLDEMDLAVSRYAATGRIATPGTPHQPGWAVGFDNNQFTLDTLSGLNPSFGHSQQRSISRMIPNVPSSAMDMDLRAHYMNGGGQNLDSSTVDMLDIPGKGRCCVYVARFSYEPPDVDAAEGELSLQTGEYLLVWGVPDPNAAVLDAELLDGRRGLVPARFVQRIVGDDLLDFHSSVISSMRDNDETATTIMSEMSLSREVARLSEMADMSEGPDDDESVPAPRQLTLERQLNKSVLIGWSVPEGAQQAGVECYHVYVDGVLKTTVKATERTRALVEGVDANRPHRISVRSVSLSRRTSRDAACTMVIGRDTAAMGPTCVRATHVTCSQAVISWLPANSNHQHVVCVNNVEVRTLKPGIYRHTITGLAPSTQYRVTVRAKHLRAGPPPGATVEVAPGAYTDFRTLPKGLPDPPLDILVEAGPQDGTLLVTWQPILRPPTTGPVTGYAVYADGKKVTDVDSPTGDHALIDIGKLLGLNPKCVTVRTKSRDSQSSDSLPTPIPQGVLRGVAARLARGARAGPGPRGVTNYTQPFIEHEDDLSDKEVFPQGVHTQHAQHAQQQAAGFGTGLLKSIFDKITPSQPTLQQQQLTHQQQQQQIQQPNQQQQANAQLQNSQQYQNNQQYSNAQPPSTQHSQGTQQYHGAAQQPAYQQHSQQYQTQQPSQQMQQFQQTRMLQDRGRPPNPHQIQQQGSAHYSASASRGTSSSGPSQSRRNAGPRAGAAGLQSAAHKRCRHFVALFDYDPVTMSPNPESCEEELPFSLGDSIKIFGDKDTDGFYWGECRGRRGYVPHNMVEEVDSAGGAEGTGAPRSRWAADAYNQPVTRMVALYDYDPQELSPNVDADMELSFQTGQIINVYGAMDEDGFYMAEIDGVKGLVPSNFLAEADSAGALHALQNAGGAGGVGGVGGGAERGAGSSRGRGLPGPGARGPPPPPRDNVLAPRGGLGHRKQDACPLPPSQLDHNTSASIQDQQSMQGRTRGAAGMAGVAGMQGMAGTPSSMSARTIVGNQTVGTPTQPSQPTQLTPTTMPASPAQLRRGVPAVVPASPGMTGNTMLSQQQPITGAPPPNLMQKFTDITAPGGDILSKGKELIFMKFGLGGK